MYLSHLRSFVSLFRECSLIFCTKTSPASRFRRRAALRCRCRCRRGWRCKSACLITNTGNLWWKLIFVIHTILITILFTYHCHISLSLYPYHYIRITILIMFRCFCRMRRQAVFLQRVHRLCQKFINVKRSTYIRSRMCLFLCRWQRRYIWSPVLLHQTKTLKLGVRLPDIYLIKYAFECIHNLFTPNLMSRPFFLSLLFKKPTLIIGSKMQN